jgi:beta-phosphoglucomutase-like phosphatase (HAD superfamily)
VSDPLDPWSSAVLFDFDGVIVNSEPLHFWSFHEVLKSEKIELPRRSRTRPP